MDASEAKTGTDWHPIFQPYQHSQAMLTKVVLDGDLLVDWLQLFEYLGMRLAGQPERNTVRRKDEI